MAPELSLLTLLGLGFALVLAGAVGAWALLRAGRVEAGPAGTDPAHLAQLREQLAVALSQVERLAPLEAREQALASRLADLRESSAVRIRELETQLKAEQTLASERLATLNAAREELTRQFRVLAQDILEEKSQRFTEQNRLGLSQLLDPLKERIAEFRTKVEEVYVQEGKERSALAEQVRQLAQLNRSVGEEARNLAQALKGSAKTQGNWGELILERILEASGLRKGESYRVQDSQLREDGSRAQPDVVILLPGERRLVVDAKVSLVAYERFVAAESAQGPGGILPEEADTVRKNALSQHLESIRSHVRGLADRNYHALYGVSSVDFVVMFVPIEPAFTVAVMHDESLFMDAWQRNVLLVSPSTLLFVVRTVAHLWNQEARNRNAEEIARRGGELYDRLAGFVQDLESVGQRLRQAQEAHESAVRKLSVGRGNVIRQAELLRGLGVKPNKSLPVPLVEASEDRDSVPGTDSAN